MLSKKSKYALKALVALAKKYNQGPMLISDIAVQEKIPKKFLEAILLDLRKQGILGSKIGAGGGYYLSKKPSEVTLSQVLRFTDGPIALIPCGHLCLCDECGKITKVSSCPICRKSISSRVKIFA